MSDALDRSVERLVQLRAAQRRATQTAIADAGAKALARTGLHPVGARVFDTVSAQEGEVVGRTRQNVIVPTAAK